MQWVPGLSRGKEWPGRDADPTPPSSAVGHERVELYLYSPYGPYGLYRASVPVQGCTLPPPFYLDDLEPELRFKFCQKGYTDVTYDDKSEYYIPNWAAKMGSESDFVNTLRSYEFYGEE